jgi:hypothetical protein
MKLVTYYPYECGYLGGHRLQFDMTPAMEAWRNELSAEVGRMPDNKTTFTIADHNDNLFSVQFWDDVVYLGGPATVSGAGHYYYALQTDGVYLKIQC